MSAASNERRKQSRKTSRKKATPSRPPKPPAPSSYTLELSLEQMGFLRLLLTNATIQPAQFKQLCAEVQTMIEAHIGPLPPQQ